ncbi:MAG: RecQ family ATP-dependent DNA helicase [Planctomycetes bacterium]|nr:RecQ family ATP-dependent DNA helicase [Planctomycetota bacterium]
MMASLAPAAQDLLRDPFGHDRFLPGQEAVIARLLDGRNALAIFPTGGGKSLCYQLPALVLPGLSVVVSPLLALMKDQVDSLRARGVLAARLDSTLEPAQRGAVLGAIERGELRLLYVAPERFADERFRQLVLAARVSLFAVDEAHCISEWGHNFRPDYLKLARFGRECGAERVLALTATATPRVAGDICRGFGIEEADVVRTGFYRPNLFLLTSLVESETRDRLLLERLRRGEDGPTIVYVTLRRTAEALAERLAGTGIAARAYHAGIETSERERIQDWFMNEARAVIVATIAFGMGSDRRDIRTFVHYNLPKSLVNYAQEIGRAGRDGKPAVCELLASAADVPVLRGFAERSTASREAINDLLDRVFAGPEEILVSEHEIALAHGTRPEVVRTLLVELELAGHIVEGDPSAGLYRWRPAEPLASIVRRFRGEPARFLERLFAASRLARTWYHLDADAAARTLCEPRVRIDRAFAHLGEQGLVELAPEGIARRVRVLSRPADADRLGLALHSAALARRAREFGRIEQMLRLVSAEGCRVAALAAHFGETLPGPCGHCSGCVEEKESR